MTNDEIYKRLMVMTTVKAGKSFIKTCDISKGDLSKLCKKHDIFVQDKATKENMIDRFVTETLGVKLRKKSLNRYNTK